MGFRFNKRLTIMPGVHLNLGLGGPSLSVGPRGASVNIGRKGVYGNVGIPGSGLSYRKRLDGARTTNAAGSGLPDDVGMEIRDGRIEFVDSRGDVLADGHRSEAVRTYRTEAERMLEEHIRSANESMGVLTELHLDTPAPSVVNVTDASFSTPKPEKSHHGDQEGYMSALMTWRAAKANHEATGAGASFDPASLEMSLSALAWPRETDISYEHGPDGKIVVLDVDLPEIEDMPAHEMAATMRTLSLKKVEFSTKRIADLYSAHVASVVFRLAGTVFANSPAEEVRISGYTQRSGGTGRIEDEYVVAVVVDRTVWSSIDFGKLADIDPENALRRFGARLERTGRGALRSVEPCKAL